MSNNVILNIVYRFTSQTEIRTMKVIIYDIHIDEKLNNIIYENDKYTNEEYKKVYDEFVNDHFNQLNYIYKIERIYE